MKNQQVINIYRELNQAMSQADTAKIDALTSDDFTLTHITGYEQSKIEWLTHITNKQMHYFDIKEHLIKTENNRIIGQAETTANIWGIVGTWRLQLVLDLIDKNGELKISKAVASLY